MEKGRHIRCGSLSAYIVRADDLYEATAVAVQIEGQEPWVLIPFGKYEVKRLITVDERFLIALGKLEMNNGTCMAVLDAAERKFASKTIRDARINQSSHLLAHLGQQQLWDVRGVESRRWSLPGLTELLPLKTPFMHVEDIALRDDGAIVAKGRDINSDTGMRSAPPLLFIIQPDGESVRSMGSSSLKRFTGYATLHSIFQLSPSGRFIVRAHDGSILVTDENGLPVSPFDGIKDVSDDDLIPTLKRLHLHGIQEVWNVDPFEFRARYTVRSQSLFDCLLKKPTTEAVELDAKIKGLEKVRADLRGSDEDEFRRLNAELDRLNKQRRDFSMARAMLWRCMHFAKVASYETWRPSAPAIFDLPLEGGSLYEQLVVPLNTVRGAVDRWAPDDGNFVVTFSDGLQRVIELNGACGLLEAAVVRPATTIPPDLNAAAKSLLRQRAIWQFELADLGESGCLAAIDALRNSVSGGIEAVAWGREMILKFLHEGGALSEEKFFDHVARTCPNAMSSLRELLKAFDNSGLDQTEVWSTELVSASGFPAEALARLDPHAYDALQGYFDRRDPSHEPWGLERVLPLLVFRTEDALRFALEQLHRELDRGHTDGKPIAEAILRDARTVYTPAELVPLISNVAGRRGNARLQKMDTNALLRALRSAARATDQWDAAFVQQSKMRRT